MKKKRIFLLLLLFVQVLDLSSGYIFIDFNPNIISDKDSYYPNENIDISSQWNTIMEFNENLDIRILFLEQSPENYNSLRITLENKINEIKFLDFADPSLYNTDYTYFDVSINSSILYNQTTTQHQNIWITLVFFNWIGGEIDETSYEFTHYLINLNKFVPILKSNQINNYNLEYNDDFSYNDFILAQEKNTFYYYNSNICLKLHYFDNYVEQIDITSNIYGFFNFNFNQFNHNEIGIYRIEMEIAGSEFFLSNNITIYLNISEKMIWVNSTQKSNNYEKNMEYFKFKVELFDCNQNILVIDDISWEIESELYYIDWIMINESYIFNFNYPDSIGEYFTNINLKKSNYIFYNFSEKIIFRKNTLDLSIKLNYINYNNNISLIIEEKNYFPDINNNNLVIQAFTNDEWINTNYNLLEKNESKITILLYWENFEFKFQPLLLFRAIYYEDDYFYLSISNNFELDHPIYANFSLNTTYIIEGQSIHFNFIGFEGNNPTTYLWDFGDDLGTSNLKDPIYKYSFPGNYSVSLLIIDNLGNFDSICRLDIISVSENKHPSSNFSVDNLNIIEGQQVKFNFNGIEGNNPTTYLWDFGDNKGTSISKNPSYEYKYPGNYSVSLLIIDYNNDSSYLIKNNHINVDKDKYPNAKFFKDINVIDKNYKIDFIFNGTEGNNPASFLWDFGDGNYSIIKNPQHSYNELGLYNVSLIVIDSDGDSSRCQLQINIADIRKKSAFNYIIIPIIGVILTISLKKKREKKVIIPLHKLSV